MNPFDYCPWCKDWILKEKILLHIRRKHPEEIPPALR